MQAEAVIYLSNARGCSQNEWYRSYHTFDVDRYEDGRNSIGALTALNDDTLKAGRTLTHSFAKETAVLLLPLIGELQYKGGHGIEGSMDVGEAHVLLLPAGSTLDITNAYQSEPINYLQLWFTIDGHTKSIEAVGQYQFDLIDQKNKLINLHTTQGTNLPGSRILIGKYGGRNEGRHQLKDPAKGVFAFVVDGTFEVQNRLLQSRDGLWISNVDGIEFEALSLEGILILIEGD